MPALYIFEDATFRNFFPLTYNRPICLLRCGAATLLERQQRQLGTVNGLLVRPVLADVLAERYPELAINEFPDVSDGLLLVNGRWLILGTPDEFPPDTAGVYNGELVWLHLSPETAASFRLPLLHQSTPLQSIPSNVNIVEFKAALVAYPWDLIANQKAALKTDWQHFGRNNEASLYPGVHLLGEANMHLGRRVKIYPGCVLDAEKGPIIIEEGTEIRPNAVITGPVAIGKNCLIRTGAEIREENAFGPGSRVGGEVMASIILGNANKQHHGFLGQSILGEFSNLGAGTTTSNLKNTYGTIRMPVNGTDVSTGLQFLGSVVGDHAKVGIGTYLSTGSVVGFASHIMVSRPPKFTPSFAWVTGEGMETADRMKMLALARTVMSRRHVELTAAEEKLFLHVANAAVEEELQSTG